MSGYDQCNACKAFLIPADDEESAAILIKHSITCLYMDTDDEEEEESFSSKRRSSNCMFRKINFKEVRVNLERISSSQLGAISSTTKKRSASKKPIVKRQVKIKISRPKPTPTNTTNASSNNPFMRTYRYHCSSCPGKFYSKVEYNRHIDVHTGRRRLITCVVCKRVFNKRDSLNSHVTAHERAEEDQERYDLLHAWPVDRQLKSTWGRIRQVCKYCLIVHTNHHSFVEHMKTDHNAGELNFPCQYSDCNKECETVKELLEHAKTKHPDQFYGRLTLKRLKRGFYTGHQVMPRDEFGNYIKVADRRQASNCIPNEHKRKQLKRKKRQARKKKPRVDLDSDPEENVVQSGINRSSRSRPNLERRIELGCVHITDEVIHGENRLEVKIEPNYCSTVTSMCHRDVPKVEPSENNTDVVESEPVILDIKHEIL